MLSGRVRFGPFEIHPETGVLWRDGTRLPIQDLPFRLLITLLERPGELVTRAELTTALWGAETFVDATAGLNTAIAKLRDALGDDAERPAYVETVPKRGYRFVGTIAASDDPATSPGVTRENDGTYVARNDASVVEQPRGRRWLTLAAVAVAVLSTIAVASYRIFAARSPVRVAVVLFDNETSDADLTRLAQDLTDATVFALTAQPRLAVIGNAAILRTERPFRDIAAIRDSLQAAFIVIGQVQRIDTTVIVRTHLIRAADQAHVWVYVSNLTGDGEAALQSTVASQVASAVTTYALPR